MDDGIFELLKLIGSLALFLYGMKLMSESLQKLAGNKMRQILTAMTSNRFTGVLTGLFITGPSWTGISGANHAVHLRPR